MEMRPVFVYSEAKIWRCQLCVRLQCGRWSVTSLSSANLAGGKEVSVLCAVLAVAS